MRIKKVSETTPITGNITNQYNESITDGYSCDYINDLNTYSTDEQVVGTWIDGSPIYRKAIAISSLPNNTTTTYSHDIDNFSRLVNLKATWYDSSDARWYNDIRFDSSTTKICFYCNTTNIIIEGIGTNWSTRASNCVVIIEYTKTTD